QKEFIRLTEEQFSLLDFLQGTPRAAIAGCAGSGKTLLAAEKARRLAIQGWRVLLTCYNRNLATFLRDDYMRNRPPSLEIANFHQLATTLVKRSGQRPPGRFAGSSEQSRYFAETLPEQLVDAADILGPQFDAIVVDEAQDFQQNWWTPLQFLLPEPDNSTFYIFYDDNQNIYGGLRQVKNLAQTYPLTKNFRNTQRINDVVEHFYNSDHTITAVGPEGRDVPLLVYRDDRAMIEHLRKTLHNLINVNEVDTRDIVILTPVSAGKSALSRAGRLGSFLLTRNWDTDYNEIFYETIHSFKGLESPVIILTEIAADISSKADELLYVGCSRARNHLVVICHEDAQELFSSVDSVSLDQGNAR
ncbi:MAG: ATP-binding domain-containing protein, partial [Candidatus Promineifilaceae bacterium]